MNINLSSRNAKIVCTLGPSSNTYDKVRALALAGMNVARVNFSHGTHEDHKALIETVRKVSRDIDRPIAVLQDLQGPKIRVGKFKDGEIELVPGETFTITVREVEGTSEIVSVSHKAFNRDVKEGDPVLLDDGRLKLLVRRIDGADVHCEVIYGGTLSNHKGINLPGSILSIPCLTEKDQKDLEFGLEINVDYIALSFVQKPEDIDEIKERIAARGKDIPVVAKIEKPQAVEAIDEITNRTDVVMIARGDLGVEIPTEEVPHIQKEIISTCNIKGVPVITATQMLDSMIYSARPTRAEASDVANAILDGSDAVMLSGETATGAFPLEAVQTMDRIITLMEKRNSPRWDLKRRKRGVLYTTPYAIGYSACHAADLVEGAAIICLTQTGSTARMIARFRPGKPIIALTPREETYNRMAMLWGVYAVQADEFQDSTYKTIANLKEELINAGNLKVGDTIVITAGFPFHQRPHTNMMRIESV